MRAPQIIWIVMVGINMLISASKHGQKRQGEYSIFTDIIAVGISIGLLYWGGFFS